MTDSERWRGLVIDVRSMRRYQKEYFQSRDPNVLATAKKAEQLLDQLLTTFDSVGNPLPLQTNLFSESEQGG